MGTSTLKAPSYDLTPHFSLQTHPIQGPVQLYRKRDESLFLFAIHSDGGQFVRFADKIQKEKHPNLCSFHGDLFMEENMWFQERGCWCKQKGVYNFWTFHNFTLKDKICQNIDQGKLPDELELWKMIKQLISASSFLAEYGVYVDLELDNVQMSPMQTLQLYWGNAKIGNGHRAFYQIMGNDYKKQYFSMAPEELAALKTRKIGAKLDLQKCLTHSLGRLLLLYSTNQTDPTILTDLQTFSINKTSQSHFLNIVKQIYSAQFYHLVTQLLEQNPRKRMGIIEMTELLQSQECKILVDRLRYKVKGKKSKEWSPRSRASSSTASLTVRSS